MARGKISTAVKVYRQTGSRDLARAVLMKEHFGEECFRNPSKILHLLDKLDLGIVAEYKRLTGCPDLEAETHLFKTLEDSCENG